MEEGGGIIKKEFSFLLCFLIKTEILYTFQRCCPMGVRGHVSHIIMDTSGNGTPQSVAYLYTEENAGKYNDFIHIFRAKTRIFRFRNL